MISDIIHQRKFSNWQNQEIDTFYGTLVIKKAISIFVREAIAPYILNHGYMLNVSLDHLENSIATFMFYYADDKNYMFPTPNTVSFSSEHYHHFNFILNWDNFWKVWEHKLGHIFDYATSSMSVHIESIVWGYIDLNKSKAYNDYMLEIKEYELDKKEDKIDPYLRDQLNRQNHHKFTKFEL
jgi:hypothetical protein